MSYLTYKLNKDFVNSYPLTRPGMNPLSSFVLPRTYSRKIFNEEGEYVRNEYYREIIERVVNGTGTLLTNRMIELQQVANYVDKHMKRFFDLVYNFKITPPGRGFWAMGTKLVHENKVSLSLVNCTFISSKNIKNIGAGFFEYVMDCLMLGVGVGFDIEGDGKLNVVGPELGAYIYKQDLQKDALKAYRHEIENCTDNYERQLLDDEYNHMVNLVRKHRYQVDVHTIGDSREGWVTAVWNCISQHIEDGRVPLTIFDFSKIRPKGTPLKTFGGTASGPVPLMIGMARILRVLRQAVGRPLSGVDICDICNIIAVIVIAGNVRRSSQICLSQDPTIINIKEYDTEKYAYRAPWGYSSNNSLIVEDSEDLESKANLLVRTIIKQGEPGIFNIDLARHYGRIVDGRGNYDLLVGGSNPCGEISLEGSHPVGTRTRYTAGGETCNLCEVHLHNYCIEGKTVEEIVEDVKNDLYYAVLYCKLVTLIPPHWKSTQAIQDKNRRIGVSLTSIRTFMARLNLTTTDLAPILDTWYREVVRCDRIISTELCINRSIKLTTVKPSGTVTLCGGSYSNGMHCPHAKYFYKNTRISKEQKSMINVMKRRGYKVEDAIRSESTTSVISVPCMADPSEPTRRDKDIITIENQFELLACLQAHWSDNQVSCTINFHPEEECKIHDLLLQYKDKVKSLSMFALNTTFYPQLPIEVITEEEYLAAMAKITPFEDDDFIDNKDKEEELDVLCDGDKCYRV